MKIIDKPIGKAKDLTGLHFGDWLVLEYVGREKNRTTCAIWKCQCKCGNIYLQRSSCLLTKNSSFKCKKRAYKENSKPLNIPSSQIQNIKQGAWNNINA